MKEQRDKAFNVMFTAEEFEELGRLAAIDGRSRGGYLRAILKNSSDMEKGVVCRCADGRLCIVPGMVNRKGEAELVGRNVEKAGPDAN